MTKLYDLPFEHRIRIKYMMFGVMIGITFMTFCFAIPFILSKITDPIFGIDRNINTFEENMLSFIMTCVLFIFELIACYWLWYSKGKPRKRPELENIGLKWDYDKVKQT